MNEQNKKNEVENDVKEEVKKEIPSLTESELSLDSLEQPKEEKVLPTIEIETKIEESTEEEPPSEEVVVGPIETLEVPKKKKSHVGLIIIIIAVLLFVLGGIYFIFNNGKNLFLSSVNKEYGNIMSELDTWVGNGKYETLKNTSALTKGNFNFTIHVDESLLDSNSLGILTEINKLDGTFESGIDYKNKKIASTFGLRYNKSNMIDVGLYGQEKNLYIELKNLFDKYLKMPINEFDGIFEDPKVQVEDTKYIVKTVKDAFLNSLEAKDFKKSTETIKVDKEDVKATKIAYTLNNERAHKIYDKMLSILEKDDTFIEKIAKLTGKNENDVKTSLSAIRAKGKTETLIDSSEELVLSVYTKGLVKEAVRYEIAYKSGNEKDSIAYTKNKESSILSVQTQKGEILNAEFIHKSAKESQVILSSGTVQMDIILTKETSVTKMQYTLTEQSTSMKVLGSVTMDETKEKNQYVGTVRANAKLELQGSSLAELGMESNYVTSIGQTIELPALTNSTDIKNLTEYDSNLIMQNLMQNPVFMQFMTNIQRYIPSNPTVQ